MECGDCSSPGSLPEKCWKSYGASGRFILNLKGLQNNREVAQQTVIKGRHYHLSGTVDITAPDQCQLIRKMISFPHPLPAKFHLTLWSGSSFSH